MSFQKVACDQTRALAIRVFAQAWGRSGLGLRRFVPGPSADMRATYLSWVARDEQRSSAASPDRTQLAATVLDATWSSMVGGSAARAPAAGALRARMSSMALRSASVASVLDWCV